MRTLILVFISVWISLSANAQSNRLDYYQHTKTVYANGSVQTQSGNNGQFVKREGLRCYDTTSSGLDHLNGQLSYIDRENGCDVYKGPSYWGNNSTYQFDDARGYLNVKDAKGNIYVFRRVSAPSGRTRSSYLKQGAASNGYDYVAEWNKLQHPVNDTGSGSGSSGSKTTTKKGTTSSSGTCGYCHGSKRVRASVGVSGFGVSNTKKKCTTCGVWYDPTSEHWHDCPYCK